MKRKTLEEAIMSDEPNMLPGATQINFKKAAQFKEACSLLEKLKQQGKLDYKAEDAKVPLAMHSIQIKWKYDDGDMAEVPAKEMAKVFEKMDTICVTKGIDWIALFTTLYKMRD